MKKYCVERLAIVAVAGLACSAAFAQRSGETAPQIQRKSQARTVGHTAPLRDGGNVDPIKVEVNGVEVPFTLIRDGSGPDTQTNLYDNVGTGPNFASTNHQNRTLDDFTLAGGQPVLITGVRPSWATPAVATGSALQSVSIDVQFYGSLNPAVTPVIGAPASNTVRITFAAPAAPGWLTSAVYTSTAFVLDGGGNNIVTAGGAVDVRIINGVTLAPHADFDPAFCGSPVLIGSSDDNAFFDLNSDGVYQGADAGAGNEAVNFGGAPNLANLRIAIQGRVLEPTAGACCLPGGSCVVLTNSKCVGLTGIYNGDGSTCASVAGHCATPPVLHNNGPLSTGPNTLTGVAAPAGATWAEGVVENGCASNINGPNGSGTFRIADDFTVPAGKSWTITKLSTFCYQSPGSPTTFPSTQTMTLRIWNGRPDLPTSSVVFGDATTPLTPTAVFTNIYRCFNTAPLGQIPGTTRPIWRMDLPLNLTLPAGTYWADWNNSTATFSPQLAMMTNASNGVRDASNPNAMQFVLSNPPNVGGIWQLIGEGGAASGCLAANYDMPFILEGAENSTGSPCYANCDGSTQQPCLNVLDFGCFLNKFSSGDSYANCDNSTQPPILNVLDFGCFLNKFAAGCSAC